MYTADYNTAAVIFFLIIYLFPWMIAQHKKHSNQVWIFAMNVLLGWTGIFWVIALVWAIAGENIRARERKEVREQRKRRKHNKRVVQGDDRQSMYN